MIILAIDTATEACSAALSVRGEILERFQLAPQEHSRLILGMIESLLEEAGFGRDHIDGLAFGRGPGSFTGLRIGAGVVQGLAFALDLPVARISTLAALAQALHTEQGAQRVFAALDARMQQIYCGAYAAGDDGYVQSVQAEEVGFPAAVAVPPGSDWVGGGSGWDAYGAALSERIGPGTVWHQRYLPHARYVAVLAQREFAQGSVVPADQAVPVYLRDEVADRRACRA